MTPQEREDLRAKFTEVEDWLYEEGMDLDAKAYEKKRAELEKLAAPVFLRKTELEARPKVVSTTTATMSIRRSPSKTSSTRTCSRSNRASRREGCRG